MVPKQQVLKEAVMVISPQLVLFLAFMLIVVQATRLDEKRQRKREEALRRSGRTAGHLQPMAGPRH